MRLPSIQKIPALQPTELSDVTQRAVDELLREGESQNTMASYRSALRYLAAWYGIRYGSQIQLPVPAACVLQFIVDHAERSTDKGLVSELPSDIDQALVNAGYKGKLGALAHNTLQHRISVLSKVHQMHELKNPCQDSKVRELLSRTRKAYAKRGALPRKKAALTKSPLEALLATCDDSMQVVAEGVETQAQMEFLRPMGDEGYLYALTHSKTNQSGLDRPEDQKPVIGIAAAALKDWLAASRIASGAIFRRVRKGGHIGEALSPAAVRDIVKARCALAGIEGEFSAHSLRSGFVTEAGRQNVPLAETMAMSGHTSIATAVGYFRADAGKTNPAANLMGSAPN